MKSFLMTVLFGATVLYSQDVQEPILRALPQLRTVEPEPRAGIAGSKNLTLREALELALANDPEIQISRLMVEETNHRLTAAAGYFDPVISLDAYRSRTVAPVASLIGGSASGKLTSKELNFSPTLKGSSPLFGTSYQLGFSDSKQISSSTFNILNPQYPASATLKLTQPLWRGLRIDAGRYQLLVARKNRQLSLQQLKQRITERITVAIQYYWELRYAWQNLDVQTEAVRLATEQYESNRRQAEQGVLAPVSVVEAQTQVATFEQAQASATQALTIAENNLKQVITSSRTDGLWNTSIKPETEPDATGAAPRLADALSTALSSRPELSASALNLAVNELALRYNRELVRPQVDVYAQLTSSGLAGSQQTVSSQFASLGGGSLAPILIGSNSQSLSNIWSGNFPAVKVGVTVSLPIRNRTAEANAALSAAEDRRLEILRNQTLMAVEADVRNAIEQINSARARYEAARVARQSAEEQYASEKRQFEAGASTMFLVFQRQTAFISARSGEERARTDLAEARSNLDRATAQTLERYQIKLNP
jgi:outer membrane protein TolC